MPLSKGGLCKSFSLDVIVSVCHRERQKKGTKFKAKHFVFQLESAYELKRKHSWLEDLQILHASEGKACCGKSLDFCDLVIFPFHTLVAP